MNETKPGDAKVEPKNSGTKGKKTGRAGGRPRQRRGMPVAREGEFREVQPKSTHERKEARRKRCKVAEKHGWKVGTGVTTRKMQTKAGRELEPPEDGGGRCGEKAKGNQDQGGGANRVSRVTGTEEPKEERQRPENRPRVGIMGKGAKGGGRPRVECRETEGGSSRRSGEARRERQSRATGNQTKEWMSAPSGESARKKSGKRGQTMGRTE